LQFIGNNSNPASVIVNLAGAGSCFNATLSANVLVQGMTLGAAVGADTSPGNVAGSCLSASLGGSINFQNIIFGTTQRSHFEVATGGYIAATGNYTITGGSEYHMVAGLGGIGVALVTVTLTGTPAFTGAFAWADEGEIYAPSVTYVGSATGQRYLAVAGGQIITNGGGANYFPGSIAGSASTGYYS
jgi:hypothetical protein